MNPAFSLITKVMSEMEKIEWGKNLAISNKRKIMVMQGEK